MRPQPPLFGDPAGYYNVGLRFHGAVQRLSAGEALAPVFDSVRGLFYLLGVARMGAGNADGARAALTQYLALAPSRYVDQTDDAKRRLTMLGSQETKP